MNRPSNRATDRLTVDRHWIPKELGEGELLTCSKSGFGVSFYSFPVCTDRGVQVKYIQSVLKVARQGDATIQQLKAKVAFFFHAIFTSALSKRSVFESHNNCWSDLVMKTWTIWSDYPACARESQVNLTWISQKLFSSWWGMAIDVLKQDITY